MGLVFNFQSRIRPLGRKEDSSLPADVGIYMAVQNTYACMILFLFFQIYYMHA